MTTQRLVTAPTARPESGGALIGRAQGLDTSLIHPRIGSSIDMVRQEVQDAFDDMATFHNLMPDEIMRIAAGHSARLSWLRVLCFRVEDRDREWKDIRQRELEPTIEELKMQRENGSRLHSVRELDWKMESGER